MVEATERVIGVDACSGGWFATVLDEDGPRTMLRDEFTEIADPSHAADLILVDIPIGLPETTRRECDIQARDRLGSRALSVFYPPCGDALEYDDYSQANEEHQEHMDHGLSQQAYHIREKIREVNEVVDTDDQIIRESHPELCFAALNDQPIAYSKTSVRGRQMRMHLLNEALPEAIDLYEDAREEHPLVELSRDDILDSLALAIAAQREQLVSVPDQPSSDQPRIYFPQFEPHQTEID